MHAATVWEAGQKQTIQAALQVHQKYNTTHSIHFTADLSERVVGDTSLRGQNCVISRIIVTPGSVSCTNVGTISNMNNAMRLKGKRMNTTAPYVSSSQWGAEQYPLHHHPPPPPRTPSKNQCNAMPGGYWSLNNTKRSTVGNAHRGAAALTENYRYRDARDGFR